MPSVNDLEVRFSSQRGNTAQYLCELNREVERWQEWQENRRTI